MVGLLAAFQFLTITPPIIKRAFTARELGRSVGWYSLVGLAVGGVLYGGWWALGLILPPGVAAAVLVAAWLVLTRGLHLDGLMDTCDGLFGGWTPERRLEIMRDSRVGAFGVAGGVVAVLVKYTALSHTLNPVAALLLAPVIGRWVMALALVAFSYGRESGLGHDMKDQAGWVQTGLAAAIMLAVAWLTGGAMGLATAGGATAFALLLVWWVLQKIPEGLTGDIYGALCEISEMLVLIVFAANR